MPTPAYGSPAFYGELARIRLVTTLDASEQSSMETVRPPQTVSLACWMARHAIAAGIHRRQHRRVRANEGIEHGVTREGEHANEPVRNLLGKRRRVVAEAGARHVIPDGAKPAEVLVLADAARLLHFC